MVLEYVGVVVWLGNCVGVYVFGGVVVDSYLYGEGVCFGVYMGSLVYCMNDKDYLVSCLVFYLGLEGLVLMV